MDSEELLRYVESLKAMLVSYATGSGGDDDFYKEARRALLSDSRLRGRLPKFVSSCRDLGEFWPFIKGESPSYQGRREYLREEFDSVLTLLEGPLLTPSDVPVLDTLTRMDSSDVQEVWQKALERRGTDPEGAITAARTLLETVCKNILDELGVGYADDGDLPKLHGLVATNLDLAPNQHTEEVFRQILGECYSIVNGLASVRNRLSDAHGKGKAPVKPAPRHAELAVNLSGAMATFLIQTWEARRERKKA